METMIKNTGSKEKTRRTQEACHMVKQYDASAATTSELTEKYIIRRGWSLAVDSLSLLSWKTYPRKHSKIYMRSSV